MDLSNSLAQITRILLRIKCSSCTVTIHSHKDHFIVVINTDDFCGSGSSKSILDAYIKGLSELGESIIGRGLSLHCRSGLAGGLFYKTAIQRAKEELFERDAFFFHYRSLTPFVEVREDGPLYLVQLTSAIPNLHIVMAFNKDYFTGGYLNFGMGCSYAKEEAIQKAIAEYNVLDLNHKIFPNWFKNSKSTIDLHHQASIDPRNVEKIKKLMMPKKDQAQREIEIDQWKIIKIKSPIRFFKYIQVKHPKLIQIEFGKEEADGVLHPFW